MPGIYETNSKSKYTLDASTLGPNFTLGDKSVPVTILDARKKEQESGLSKREFFNKYGFVILEHKSAMSEEDWVATDRNLTKEEYTTSFENSNDRQKMLDTYRNSNTPGKKIYAKEVEELIRLLLPETKEVLAPAQGTLRRAVPDASTAPIKAIHSDYGLDFDRLVNNTKHFPFSAYRTQYEEIDANEFMLVNFWRPVLPMSKPLRSQPLAFLDASTLSKDDIVRLDLVYNGELISEFTSLKENARHQFYYYPDMSTDEVIMFKQFHQVRNESTSRMPAFHTAFPDPMADNETEERTSFEYRFAVLS